MIDEKKLIERLWEQHKGIMANQELYADAEEVANEICQVISIIDEQPKTDWVPFEQREADEEEKAHFLEHYGYELEYMLCGRLPDEDEEILVTYANGNVGEDIFLRDGYECYLDSGAEFITEAIAWMPKPQPYKKEGEE